MPNSRDKYNENYNNNTENNTPHRSFHDSGVSNYQDIIYRLQDLEKTLKEQGTQSKDFEKVLGEVKNIIHELQITEAKGKEKQAHLFYRIEEIQKDIDAVSEKGEKNSDKHSGLIENALMVFLGAVLSYVFSMMKG